MSLRPQARHEALTQARQRQKTAAFGRLYAQRAGIEATLSLAVRSFGLRRARYAGLAKVRLQHIAMAAALNLTRIVHWIGGEPIATTRLSHFSRLLNPHASRMTSPAVSNSAMNHRVGADQQVRSDTPGGFETLSISNCNREPALPSVMLVPANAADVVPAIRLVAAVALLDAGMLLPGDLLGNHLEVHHVMTRRRLVALGAVRRCW